MVIANEAGVFKCKTIRRVLKEHMSDPMCLDKVTMNVTEFLKSGARTSDPARIIEPMPQAPKTDEPEMRRQGLVPRRMRLSPKDFESHGDKVIAMLSWRH